MQMKALPMPMPIADTEMKEESAGDELDSFVTVDGILIK
jgi:hypothetical protein